MVQNRDRSIVEFVSKRGVGSRDIGFQIDGILKVGRILTKDYCHAKSK